jgi:hypothetical protein
MPYGVCESVQGKDESTARRGWDAIGKTMRCFFRDPIQWIPATSDDYPSWLSIRRAGVDRERLKGG